mmetsp:Transcript_17416/g.35286  ORF Transcript_17416/g.35286 Transcript_17416/m.35286 type:complete len:421 (-) Transcript_17416:91-1353(-)
MRRPLSSQRQDDARCVGGPRRGLLGPRWHLVARHLLLVLPHPAGDRDQPGGRHVRVPDTAYHLGAGRPICPRHHLEPSVDAPRLLLDLPGPRRLRAHGSLRHLRGGLRHGRHAGPVHQHDAGRRGFLRPQFPRVHRRGAEVLELPSAAVHAGLSLLGRVGDVLLEQCLPRRSRAVHHRRRGGHLVLPEGAERDSLFHLGLHIVEEVLCLPPRFACLRLPHPGCGPDAQMVHALLVQAGEGAEEQGHGDRREGLRILPVVLREVHQVFEQERVHPGRPLGDELLHIGEERLLFDLAECRALWGLGGPGCSDPLHREVLHPRSHRRPRLLDPRGHAPGARVPVLPHHFVLRRRLLLRRALHERLRARGGLHAPVLHRHRGDGHRQLVHPREAASLRQGQRGRRGQGGLLLVLLKEVARPRRR